MSKTKWYFRRHCERSVAILLALTLMLSLGIVAVPMAGTVEANTAPGEVWVDDGATADGTVSSYNGTTKQLVATTEAFAGYDVDDAVEFISGTADRSVTTIAIKTNNTTVTLTDDVGAAVNDTFNLVNLDAPSSGDPFRYIQSGIDMVAGSTVHVAAGTYDEQVVIDKNLTLQGQGDSTVIKPSQATANAFQLFSRKAAPADVAPIVVASGSGSTSVTIKDLKVDGSDVSSVPTGAGFFTAIQYSHCSGTVDSVTVDGINIQHTGHGMWLSAWEHAATVEVTGCTISGYNWDGICADRSMLTVNIHDNTITGAGVTTNPDNTQNAIQVGRGVTGTISGNTISENMYEDPDWYSIGIMLYSIHEGVVVVEGNRIWNCDSAVHIYYADNTIVRNNVLTNNVVGGVTFEGTSDYNLITSNELSNNKYGIDHDSDTPGPHNEAHYNNIFGNTEYGVFSNPRYEIDATKNWWGDASGPTHASNPAGSGDAVSDNVDFDPWLVEEDGTETEETESETVSDSGTMEDTPTGGDVTIDATGDHTITTAKYAENPGGTPTFEATGNYYDVHLDDDTNVDSLTIEFCPADEETVIYYWDGTSWRRASSQIHVGDCIGVYITDSTFPSLSDLSGRYFASGTPYLVARAGGPYTGTAGSPVTLSGSATGGTPPYSYAWDLDYDGAYDDSAAQNPSYTWDTPGDYTVGLQVTDSATPARIATDTASVHISPPPAVGGEAYPVSKLAILAPWIALAVALTWIFIKARKLALSSKWASKS